MDMEVKSWSSAQEKIRKYAQSHALKADLVQSTPKNQGHIVMKLSEGSSSPAPWPSSQSPGKQRKKYDSGSRGREKSRGGEAQGSGRSSRDPNNSRVCGTAMR